MNSIFKNFELIEIHLKIILVVTLNGLGISNRKKTLLDKNETITLINTNILTKFLNLFTPCFEKYFKFKKVKMFPKVLTNKFNDGKTISKIRVYIF